MITGTADVGHFHDQARWDDKAGAPRYQQRHHAIVRAAGLQPGMRVLDVASGRGEVAILAAKAGCRVWATDIGPKLVDAIHANAAAEGVVVVASVADMREHPFPDGHFDRVIGCAALHHLDRDGARAAVREALRVTAPSGRVIFSEPTENVPWFDQMKHLFPSHLGRPSALNRAAYARYIATRDDRPMSDEELLDAWPKSQIVGRYGMFARVVKTTLVDQVDDALLRALPFIGRYAQAGIVEYRK